MATEPTPPVAPSTITGPFFGETVVLHAHDGEGGGESAVPSAIASQAVMPAATHATSRGKARIFRITTVVLDAERVARRENALSRFEAWVARDTTVPARSTPPMHRGRWRMRPLPVAASASCS